MIIKKEFYFVTILLSVLIASNAFSQESGLIPKFELKSNKIELSRIAQPHQYFDKIGRKAALMGYENGSFEMWVWPWKVLRQFDLQFYLGTSTTPVKSSDVLRTISVTPEATIINFTYQSFSVKEIIIVPVEKPGALILLSVFTTTPLKIIPGFIPVMQPEWPAGIGGQYSYWDNDVHAYVISESQQRAIFLCGSPAGKEMTAPPAHMFADNPLQFKIEVAPGETVSKYIPIVIAGGIKAKYSEVKNLYNDLWKNAEEYYLHNYDYYQNLEKSTIQVITPDKRLNLAFAWGKIALHNLLVKNPDLGEGLVAGYGLSGAGERPGFAWFFGGDAFINSLAINSYQDFSTEKDALSFAQKWQREEDYPIRKKSLDEVNHDIGKMAHELSQSDGLVDWWNDYHYGYNHADTTPWYLVAMGDYYHQSGDLKFIKKSWKSIKQAYQWCLNKDSDSDGLMDLKGAGLGALEFGKYVHIYADAYTSMIWTEAINKVIEMANAVGDSKLKSQAEVQLKKASEALEEKFWINDLSIYAYGATEDGKKVEEKTPWPVLGMEFGLLDSSRVVKSFELLNDADLVTDWGIRSLSVNSKLFDPMNYNYGAVWPFIGSFFATAQYRCNYNLAGYSTLCSIVNHVFEYGLGVVPEVFSGLTNQKLSEAYHDQGFSTTGYIEPLMKGLLGLDVNAANKTIRFSPHIPANWDSVTINHIKIDKDIVNLKLFKNDEALKLFIDFKGEGKINIIFEPNFDPGIKVKSVFLNNKEHNFKDIVNSHAHSIITDFKLTEKTVILINHTSAPEIYIINKNVRQGQDNREIKVLSQKFSQNKIVLSVQGLSGHDYILGITHPELVKSIYGAELLGDKILVKTDDLHKRKYLKKEIKIEI